MSHASHAQQTKTEDGARAVWSVAGPSPVVLFVDDDERSDRPAYRWPAEPMPACRPGHIAFGPGEYPSLERAREMLPEYGPLWDAVEADIRAARPVAYSHEHGGFFALPA